LDCNLTFAFHHPTPAGQAPLPSAAVDAALSSDLSFDADFARFKAAATQGNLIPLYDRVMADQLTPVLAYRCLVKSDDREAPSFLFESVVNGDQQGRYSFVGAHPALEIVARNHKVDILDHRRGQRTSSTGVEDPLQIPIELSSHWRPVPAEGLPRVFTGGWVGYCGYDTVRYVYGKKLPFESSPPDDRGLPDMHLALYTESVLFDNATKLAYVVAWVCTDDHGSVEEAYLAGRRRLAVATAKIAAERAPQLMSGKVRCVAYAVCVCFCCLY
jgi:anthranilate synthase component I